MGIEFFKRFTGDGRDTSSGEGMKVTFFGEDTESSFAVLEGGGEVIVDGQVTFGNGGNDEVDVVGFVTCERLEFFGEDELTVDEHFLKAGFFGGGGIFFVEAFAGF